MRAAFVRWFFFGIPDMLKKVSVEHLRVGMYIHEFCGSWMEHPFWRSQFKLNDPADLRRIREESDLTEVWIDVSKGHDVLAAETVMEAASEADIERAVDRTLLRTEAPARVPQKTSLTEELLHAEKICARAKAAVIEMFQDVRMGKAVSVEAAGVLVDDISGSVMRNSGALISLARLKNADDYTYMHSVAVCALMTALGRQLGLDEAVVRELGVAGLLHDLGKAHIPMGVLNKPGKLTDDEFAVIKSHPQLGFDTLVAHTTVGEIPLDVVLHHHEKTNGTGYPKRLQGDAISLYAKMGAVCDVYDAITSNRPYKSGWDPAISISKMAEWCDGHFDQRVFQAFVKCLGIYPIGSLVRLASGKLGVVVEQSEKSLLHPQVKVFFSTRAMTHIPVELIDLSQSGVKDKILSRETAETWGLKQVENLWAS
jgi:putative nucleotidyltransferase with HDIG domain